MHKYTQSCPSSFTVEQSSAIYTSMCNLINHFYSNSP